MHLMILLDRDKYFATCLKLDSCKKVTVATVATSGRAAYSTTECFVSDSTLSSSAITVQQAQQSPFLSLHVRPHLFLSAA